MRISKLNYDALWNGICTWNRKMRHVATHKYIGCETAADYRVVGRDGFRFRDGSENIKAHHVRHKKRVNILIDKWFPEYTKYELIER